MKITIRKDTIVIEAESASEHYQIEALMKQADYAKKEFWQSDVLSPTYGIVIPLKP